MADSNFEQNSSDNATPKGASLRRGNTLKAYLANKNKLKERQAINIIVDPTVIQQNVDESSASENEILSPLSPSNLVSPVSGRRIDSDLDAIDKEKKGIEEQLANITQQLNQSTPPPDQSSLTAERTRLCQELDLLLKKRRELLESWTRDYKSLKRSGSLAKRQQDTFWVTTA
ncbi:hypothetical protein BGX21_002626 [Mortierella sp. AD011]|nr:hypothetical protein BGX20_011010 [Mortierella sp. AD010]KAF9379497.1 hypothetical protein BGX21_002626 [Mortierella sp. AD011]